MTIVDNRTAGVAAWVACLRVFNICVLGLAAVINSGCSRRVSTEDPGPPPPHAGKLIFFPDGSGIVEVVKREGAQESAPEVSFYFYSDAFTPCDPAPQSGVLIIDGDQKVILVCEGDALVTPKGANLFGDEDVSGVLNVELDGETRQIPLGIR